LLGYPSHFDQQVRAFYIIGFLHVGRPGLKGSCRFDTSSGQ